MTNPFVKNNNDLLRKNTTAPMNGNSEAGPKQLKRANPFANSINKGNKTLKNN